MDKAEILAKKFHETYERLAPEFSYETRKASAVPWVNVPQNNRNLMIAVCAEISDSIAADAIQEMLEKIPKRYPYRFEVLNVPDIKDHIQQLRESKT